MDSQEHFLNSSNLNTGKNNNGDNNSGDNNSGDYNSGDYNGGNRNSGDFNFGVFNSGDWNSGSFNSGDRNSGNYNSGIQNCGDGNSGDYNIGDHNSGDWNKCNFSSGCFNTAEPKIYMFNKISDWTYSDWMHSDAHFLLSQIMDSEIKCRWLEDMTDDEKVTHPEAAVTGSYLKKSQFSNTECSATWWSKLSKNEKSIIMSIPNFDKYIFKEITGIDVDED